MKPERYIISLLLIIAPAFVFFGCNKDEEEEEVRNYAPELPSGTVGLNHDTYNVDAPLLVAGLYEQGSRFSAADQAGMIGGRLTQIRYYVASEPVGAEVRVYRNGSNLPEDLVYSASVTDEINRSSWNIHTLSDTLLIEDSPLWITVRFQAGFEGRFIGCDPGPAHGSGDWMWDDADGTWSRFLNRTGASINWNVRGVVDPQ